jgi:hypothetical protein
MQTTQPQPPDAARSTGASIPIIFVEDYTQEPVITTKYVCGANELDFQAIYTSISSLLTHPTCTHNSTWPCSPCSSTFSEKYWSSAASLLDYLADFLPYDTALMQSLWFYLLDIWQESTTWYPCNEAVENKSLSPNAVAAYTSARWIQSEYTATITLMNQVIFGVQDGAAPREGVIHPPSGDVRNAVDDYNTGPYVSGLSKWQQWLFEGSPGVAAPSSSLSAAARHVPQAAIAMIKTHTERARRLVAKVRPGDSEFLYDFDQHSLLFPTPSSPMHTYYSRLTGKTVTYQLSNGAPPVQRYAGVGDPDLMVSEPDLNLLDDCVGVCTGVEVYEPVSWEDGEEDPDSEENMVFDVWSVCEIEDDENGTDKRMKRWEEIFDERAEE